MLQGKWNLHKHAKISHHFCLACLNNPVGSFLRPHLQVGKKKAASCPPFVWQSSHSDTAQAAIPHESLCSRLWPCCELSGPSHTFCSSQSAPLSCNSCRACKQGLSTGVRSCVQGFHGTHESQAFLLQRSEDTSEVDWIPKMSLSL